MTVRMGVLALGVFGLVGCAQVSEVTGQLGDNIAALGSGPDATGEGIRTLSLLGGEVRVRGPEGYCVDQASSRSRRGFAVLAGCALLSEDAAVMPTLDALITVQFGDLETASVTGNEDAFADFLASDVGRGILAGNGDSGNISEIVTIADQAGVLVRFQDASGPAFDGTTGPQWRGFLDIQGRLATISVLSFERNVLSRSEGERLLVVAMAELAEVNAEPQNAE